MSMPEAHIADGSSCITKLTIQRRMRVGAKDVSRIMERSTKTERPDPGLN